MIRKTQDQFIVQSKGARGKDFIQPLLATFEPELLYTRLVNRYRIFPYMVPYNLDPIQARRRIINQQKLTPDILTSHLTEALLPVISLPFLEDDIPFASQLPPQNE